MTRFEDLHDTVVVLTGAGAGIGAATARALLEAGARVVAGDLRPGVTDALVEAWPGRVVGHVGDVGDPGTADALVAAAVQTWGRLDAVVANAGVGYFGGLLDVTPEQVVRMTTTNVLGTVWLARAALRQFRAAQRPGDVVVVASVAGLGVGGAEEAVYAATKAAQVQLATSLAREVRAEGVRVSVIAPAAVNTHFAAATGRFGDRAPEDGEFIDPADLGDAVVTILRQPRTIRTALWTVWSLAEPS